jgi:hypothetical protein
MRPTDPRIEYCDQGMTLRQYAAIKLCVPDSGLDWLDDMIREAQDDRFAGYAMAGLLAAAPDPDNPLYDTWESAIAKLAKAEGGAA